jgi:hypothetical protein
MRKNTSITEIEKYYTIAEDGRVYSKIRPRWLKPIQNSCGYIGYFLSFGVPKKGWYSAHSLVALKYIGKPPNKKYEIDHIDNNKLNNHYSNIQYLTHAENVQKTYDNGRVHISTKGRTPSVESRIKMSNARKLYWDKRKSVI